MADARVDGKDLQDFTTRVFVGLGMPEEDAALEAEVLVWANLRGVDSHGVQRIAEYSRQVDAGNMNPQPEIQVLEETPAIVYIEGDRAFGPVVTVLAVDKIVSKAREVGIGWALIRNTTHQGAMGYYAERIAQQRMAGIAVVCNPPNMAPPGARAAGTHNSPIAIAVPGGEKRPIVLDMATSVAAGGKLQVAVDKRASIPEEWALDAEGTPTTDPKEAKFLRPAGGYKGYGMALMFECLASVMAGNPLLTGSILQQNPPRPGTQNSFLVAVDIGRFTDVEGYEKNIDLLIDTLHGLPTVAGAAPVMVPGDPEAGVCQEREKDGIPLPPGTVEKLRVAAERFGLEMPAGL